MCPLIIREARTTECRNHERRLSMVAQQGPSGDIGQAGAHPR